MLLKNDASGPAAALFISLLVVGGCGSNDLDTAAFGDLQAEDLPEVDDGGSKQDDKGEKDKDDDEKEGEIDPALLARVKDLIAQRSLEPLPPPPPIRKELVELGQMLAFDKILSGNKNISCQTCHHPLLGTTDMRSLPAGEGAVGLGPMRLHPELKYIARHSPTEYNLELLDTMFWDGRVQMHADGSITTPAGEQITPEMEAVFEFGAASAQAMFPPTDANEMRGQPGTNEIADIPANDLQAIWAALMARLGEIPMYVEMFEKAYPGTEFEDMTFAHAANAIAGFEIATYTFPDSPWDEFLRGDDEALTADALRGAETFLGDQGKCAGCHSGVLLGGTKFMNLGLRQIGPGVGDGPDGKEDFGRMRLTGLETDMYKFRVPPLRNVALTPPYGHDGQLATLEKMVRHYARPDLMEKYKPSKELYDPFLWDTLHPVEPAKAPTVAKSIATPVLPDDEKVIGDVVEFLHHLTDERATDLTSTIPAAVPSGLSVWD